MKLGQWYQLPSGEWGLAVGTSLLLVYGIDAAEADFSLGQDQHLRVVSPLGGLHEATPDEAEAQAMRAAGIRLAGDEQGEAVVFAEGFASLYGERALGALGAQVRDVEVRSTACRTLPAALLVRDGVSIAIFRVDERWYIDAAMAPKQTYETLRWLGTTALLLGRPQEDRWDDLLAELDQVVAIVQADE